MFKITLGNGVTSPSTSQSIYSNINHGGATAIYGGDIVFDSTGKLYVSGQTDLTATPGHTFATTTLANATSSSGTAWNSTTVNDFYQLGGLGQSTRLYSEAGTSPYNLYEVTNFGNPSGSAPVFTQLTLTSGSAVQYSDLSDGALGSSIVIPEASTWGAGIFGGALVIGACAHTIRKRRDTISGLS